MCYSFQTALWSQCPKAWFYYFLLLITCLVIFWVLNIRCFETKNLRGLSNMNVISVKLLGTLRVAHNLNPVANTPLRKWVESHSPRLYSLKDRL